jgi:alpha-L-rhamnosidase
MRYFIALMLAFLTISIAEAQIKVQELLCENLKDPIGMGVEKPRFTWIMESSTSGTQQVAYELVVRQGKKTVWSSGKVSSDASVLVDYAGSPLTSNTQYTWQVRVWDNHGQVSAWSAPGKFQTAFFQPSDWKAKWIGFGADEDPAFRPVQYYRKSFQLNKKVAQATAFITAQGMYEAYLNGKRIGNDYLTPGWTSYNKRLQYQVYDVTDLMSTGNNVAGAMVGNGWFRGTLGWVGNGNLYGKQLGLLMQVHIQYTDGSTDLLLTDETWKSSYGAVQLSEIYDGETIDHTKDQKGWNSTSFNDSKWAPVKVLQSGYAHLTATYNQPVKKHEEFKAVKLIVTPKGERVIDFGQNLVGWVKLKASGNKGDRINIQHAEVLDKFGNFYTENMRSAKTTASYFLSGEGEEAFEPHFTFYGFRYIKIEGDLTDINPADFTAVTLYSDMPLTGNFQSSHPLVNQLQQNIQWGQRGNFLDVPTDCPQRDERLGWTGDAQAFSRTAAFNFNVHNFFAKWLRDVEADQLQNGSVPFVIPNVLGQNSAGSAGWADAATIIPWNLYLVYGDKRILANQYNSMKKWVGFMESKSTKDLWNTGFHFGDWLFYRPFDDNDGMAAVTDKYLIAQCFYAHSTQLLINAAQVLGNTKDVELYTAKLAKIKAAFLNEYVTPSGRLVSGTQTAMVLALNFDMLPEQMRAETAERLVENIKSYGMHLSTGFLGTPYLTDVLTRFGKTDIAYKLLLQETFPSWLYPVKMGATTIWERWGGIRPDSTFEPASMNSFNHYAYGAIGDWMYRRMAGIDNDGSSVAYKRIKIQPYLGEGFTQAGAILKTYYGVVSNSWKIDGKKLQMTTEVPVNTSAIIYVPSKNTVTVNGKPIDESMGLKYLRTENAYTVIEAGSGKFVFETELN